MCLHTVVCRVASIHEHVYICTQTPRDLHDSLQLHDNTEALLTNCWSNKMPVKYLTSAALTLSLLMGSAEDGTETRIVQHALQGANSIAAVSLIAKSKPNLPVVYAGWQW